MTETSKFWDGIVTGDSSLAPYSEEDFRTLFLNMFVGNPYVAPFTNGLHVGTYASNGAGGFDIRVSPGAGIVDGVMFFSDAIENVSVSVPVSGNYYYTLFLRKTGATVRLHLEGPTADWYPSSSSEAGITDLLLAWIRVPTGSYPRIYKPGERLLSGGRQQVKLAGRIGGGASDWHTPGTTLYNPANGIVMQFGSIQWTGAAASSGYKTVTFPYAFEAVPVFFATARVTSVINVKTISETQVEFRWFSKVLTHTSVDIYWMALGLMTYFDY